MDENLFQIQGEPHLQTISLDYSYLKKSSEHLLTQIAYSNDDNSATVSKLMFQANRASDF